MINRNAKENMLPVSVIVAASKGDVDAFGKVLQHYDRYIIKLSSRPIWDEEGNIYIFKWMIQYVSGFRRN